MADKKPPKPASRPPFLKEAPLVKADRDEDLLGGKAAMTRSPLLWFVLLFIPVLAGLYAGFNRPREATTVATAQASEIVVYKPERVAVRSPEGYYTAAKRGSGEAPCDFSKWLGKQADGQMQAELKALNRAFRILPPGAPMTMDYSEDRVNFNVDPNGKIVRVWCG